MWLRTEIDATYHELMCLVMKSLFPYRRTESFTSIKTMVSPLVPVAASSVRAIFWAILQESDWALGSLVACSAVNIPQMEQLIDLRGYRALPIDIEANTFSPSTQVVLQMFGRFHPKAYLHASYFGTRTKVDGIETLAKEFSVFTIDDRSQCFTDLRTSDTWADVTLFSTGPYKSPTAAGGAVALFRDKNVANRVQQRISLAIPENSGGQAIRILKLVLLKLASETIVSRILCLAIPKLRTSYGDFLSSKIRRVADIDSISDPRTLFKRPSPALLACIVKVVKDFSDIRFVRRIANAKLIINTIAQSQVVAAIPGAAAAIHSHWLIPIIVTRPDELLATLRRHGFDAARMAKTKPVGTGLPEFDSFNKEAASVLNNLVLIPSDTRMSKSAINLLCQLVGEHMRRSYEIH